MKDRAAGVLLILLVLVACTRDRAPVPPQALPKAATLYAQHCAACHGTDRAGVTGPALLPESLRRLKPAKTRAVIAEGRPATQMPGFGAQLDAAAIERLTAYLYAAPATPPSWNVGKVRASHVTYGTPPTQARIDYVEDPRNLFVVVETGDHHVTLLDGDHMRPVTRFATRFALHGGPKFSPDGRYVYFASRDGWISKYDLATRRMTAEIRAGINTRNIALSHDGRVVLAANYLPRTLVVLNAADLSLRQVIPVTGRDGTRSRVSAVYQAAPRQSFVVALKDVPELWELPVPDGATQPLYQLAPPNESLRRAVPAVEVRRIALKGVLDDFFFTPDYRYVIGAARAAGAGRVIDLQAGRTVTDIAVAGMPHLGSGITWMRDGRRVMATPNLKRNAITVIALDTWEVVADIETAGPGFFLRSHEQSRYAWADVFFGPHRDVMHVIDKQKLEIVKTLRPAPGKTAAHAEFDRDGRHVLVSIWADDGAVVVYDAQTLEEVERLPMRRPSGKYNLHNKLTLSEGTSH